jgi:hypothetical protein
MILRRLHLASFAVLGTFVAVHLVNHLVGLGGFEAHLAFMEVARRVYRNPGVEAVLLASVAVQVVSGVSLVARGWRARRGWIPWLQAGSGLVLALFLLNHVGAVLVGRLVLGLDTTWHFAAAGIHVPPFHLFFVPYYFLAVVANFVHLGCAASWSVPERRPRLRAAAVAVPAAVGLGLALMIVLSLSGALFPVEVPLAYRATYGATR